LQAAKRDGADKGAVLILGATSSIARHAAAAFARRGYDLVLAGRDADELDRIASDIRLRFGGTVRTTPFDACDTTSHPAFLRHVVEGDERLAGVVAAFGFLGDAERAAADFNQAADIIAVNYTGAVSVLTAAATQLADRGGGFILGLSSVAGDRGRQSNYIYGSAKGGFSIFLQGLRNRYARSGVHVVTAKLGFVDTQMTFGLPGMFLSASPERVGEALVKAVERRRDVVYIPGFWRLIMTVIKSVPERIFKRLKL
jgi:decaprenylphospho-beta-D-erythro-pentofuranosid-2-ulose 2-reductase